MKLSELKTLHEVEIYMCGLCDGLGLPEKAAQVGKAVEDEKLHAIEAYVQILTEEYGSDSAVTPNWLEAFTAIADLMVQMTQRGAPAGQVTSETARAVKSWRALGKKQPGLVQ